MRIVLRDMKNNLIVVVPENLNDLWHMSEPFLFTEKKAFRERKGINVIYHLN